MVMRAAVHAVLLCVFLALGSAQQTGNWLDFDSKVMVFGSSSAPRCDGASFKSPWFTIGPGQEVRWTLRNDGCTKQLFDEVAAGDIGLHVYGTVVSPGSGVWIDGRETAHINNLVHQISISVWSGGSKIDSRSVGGCDLNSQLWLSDQFPKCQGVVNPIYSPGGIQIVAQNPGRTSSEMRVVVKSGFPISQCTPFGCDTVFDPNPPKTPGKSPNKPPSSPGKGSF